MATKTRIYLTRDIVTLANNKTDLIRRQAVQVARTLGDGASNSFAADGFDLMLSLSIDGDGNRRIVIDPADPADISRRLGAIRSKKDQLPTRRISWR